MEDLENEELETEAPESAEVDEGIETPADDDIEVSDDGDGELDDGDDSDEEPESSEPKYEPRTTYRVLDEEYEMDDRLKGYIKNEDDEKYFRDLLERAQGLDPVKSDRNQLRHDNTRLMETEQTRQHAVTQLQEFVKNGDLKPFMETWGLDNKTLGAYLMKEISVEEMEPHQRAEYERNEQARMHSYTLQQQNEQLQTQNERFQTQQLQYSVDMALNSPDVSSYVQTYDSQKGVGAFRAEIAKLGDYYWHKNQGHIVPPEQLVKELIDRSWFGDQPGQQQENRDVPPHQRGGASRRQKVVVMDKNKPTIPGVRGSGGSPVRSYPTSIADLKKIAQEKSIGG